MGNCIAKQSDLTLRQLINSDLSNTPDVTYDFTLAKVLDVYDGDTVTIAAHFNGSIYKFRARLYGIDCAEIRGKSRTDEQKELAEKAKELAVRYLKDKIVNIKVLNGTVINGKKITEKYGRLLVQIYVGDIDFAHMLLERGLAVSYYGGTKEDF
jgi:endonuclease YncB( thermonuclease family)